MNKVFAGVTQKVGPLPVWAYGLGLGGVAIVYLRFRKAKNPPTSEGSGQTGTDAVDPQNQGLTDSAGWGSSPYTSGYTGLPDTTGSVDQGQSGTSINPATGNPWAVDWANIINADQERLKDENDALKEQLKNPPATAPAPSPPVQEPQPPAPIIQPPAPAPAPAPAPSYLPTLGPWAAKPDAGTYAALGARGYRIVRRGDGKYIAVDKNYPG